MVYDVPLLRCSPSLWEVLHEEGVISTLTHNYLAPG